MLRESATTQKELDRVKAALIPPADWRDPTTGLPAGWSTEDEEWAEWQRAMS